MKKIIAYSLWGNNPKYTIGAIKNAEQVKLMYPEWKARFYVGSSTDKSIVQSLKEKDAQVIEMLEAGNWSGMFWRFEAASDSDVMISRDCDSRITLREVNAVNEWLLSDKLFHIMRDHPWHNAPILGGMWGVKSPLLKNIKEMISKFEKGDFWQVDQNFLKLLYPYVKKHAMVHDEFFEKMPWPQPRNTLEFVGQVYDENDLTIQEHLDVLKMFIEKQERV
jgi:hypothetical protein